MPRPRYPRVDMVGVRQGSIDDAAMRNRVTQPCVTCNTWDWCGLPAVRCCWQLVDADIQAEKTARAKPGRDQWTPEMVCEAFRHAVRDGKPPLASDWGCATPDHPGYVTVQRLFGTWNTAVRAAGLTPRRGWVK